MICLRLIEPQGIVNELVKSHEKELMSKRIEHSYSAPLLSLMPLPRSINL